MKKSSKQGVYLQNNLLTPKVSHKTIYRATFKTKENYVKVAQLSFLVFVRTKCDFFFRKMQF